MKKALAKAGTPPTHLSVNFTGSFLIRSKLWVATALASMAAVQAIDFGSIVTMQTCLFNFTAGLFIYNAHSLVGRNEKVPNWQQRLTHFAGLCLFIQIAVMPISVQAIAWPGLALCFLYSRQVFIPFVGQKPIRHIYDLRKLWGVKALWIAVTVSLSVCYVPAQLANSTIHWLDFSQVFALCLANAVLFDLRDAKADQSQKIKSLAVILGHRKCLLSCQLFLFTAIIVLHFTQSTNNQRCWTLALLAMLVGSFWLPTKNQANNKQQRYDYLIDGTLFLPALFLLISRAAPS